MEKLETVKRLVRQNNYKNNDITYKQCQELGVTVNRVGLEIFARKLRAMDRAEEINSMNKHSMSGADTAVNQHQSLSFETSSQTPGAYSNTYRQGSYHSNVTPLTKAEAYRKPLIKDPAERKREITLELGTIKVREYELLKELNFLEHNDKFAEVH